MMTFKEFAIRQGITQPAVSKMVKRYAKELDGHILKNVKPWLMDDFAVEFLSKQRENIVVVHEQTDAKIRYLMEENTRLKDEIIRLQKESIDHRDTISELTIKNNDLQHMLEMKQRTENQPTAAQPLAQVEPKPKKKWWHFFS